jgi:hypothetical protein
MQIIRQKEEEKHTHTHKHSWERKSSIGQKSWKKINARGSREQQTNSSCAMKKCPQTTAWRCRRRTHRNEQISPNPKLISKIKIHRETWTNNSPVE